MTESEFDIDDAEAFRERLDDLLAAADRGGVPSDAIAGLLTAYLAQLRGDVRLPLGMPPERAREFREQAAEHEHETMEVELLITEEVLDELDLQLSAFDADEEAQDGR